MNCFQNRVQSNFQTEYWNLNRNFCGATTNDFFSAVMSKSLKNKFDGTLFGINVSFHPVQFYFASFAAFFVVVVFFVLLNWTVVDCHWAVAGSVDVVASFAVFVDVVVFFVLLNWTVVPLVAVSVDVVTGFANLHVDSVDVTLKILFSKGRESKVLAEVFSHTKVYFGYMSA